MQVGAMAVTDDNLMPKPSLPAYWAVIPAAVRYDEGLRPNAKLLYGEISALAQAGGFCYATNRYFADLYGFNIKTVGALISSLAQAGYITVDIVRGKKGDVEMRRIWIAGRAGLLCPPPPQKADTPTPNNGDPPPQKAEENNINNKTYPPISPKTVVDQLAEYANGDAGLLDALLGYAEMRRSIRAPLTTKRMVNILIANLDKLSSGRRNLKISMLEEATLKNWKTVYAPKSDFSGNRSAAAEVIPEW